MASQAGFDYYEALEVTDQADETTIKKAYRKLVLKWHPDKHPEDRDQAEERIRQINGAYEILSNPTKREAYDQQRRAVEKRKRGMAPTASAGVSPRMRIPKEFMMQPMGYPEKFVRAVGNRAMVHSRRDAKADFQSFFVDCKYSLWWLPEVNNMCRVRVVGSRGRGEELGATTGVAGGLNLAFDLGEQGQRPATDSEITLLEARKGQRTWNVNFIAVSSPAYENAFRFEVAEYRGYFLTFVPPCQLRAMPFVDEDHAIIDFMLVDFSAMFKFIDIEEVLLPAAAALAPAGGWFSIDALKNDTNVQTYFRSILGKPVWDNEDFATYFEGHWGLWQYEPKDQCVRVRLPSERLSQQLDSAKTADEVAGAISNAGEELQMLSIQATWKAMQVLASADAPGAASNGGAATGAKSGGGTVGLDVIAAVNRVAANKKICAALRAILATAQQANSPNFTLSNLVGMAETIATLGGERANYDLVAQRTAALQLVADIVFAQVELGEQALHTFQVRLIDLSRLLKLPGVADKEVAILNALRPVLPDAALPVLVQATKVAASASCSSLADAFAVSALEKLRVPGLSSVETLSTLKNLAEAGQRLTEVATQVSAIAASNAAASPAAAPELAAAISALGERGLDSEALAQAARDLATKAPFAALSPQQLLGLAVAGTKSKAIGPDVLGTVARAAAAAAASFATPDLLRLLLALAKAKGGSLQEDAKASLLSGAAAAVAPQLPTMATTELVKLVLSVACYGSSELLQAAASQVTMRLSDFPPPQLLLLTQGLFQGLGGAHPTSLAIVDYWAELLREVAAAADEARKAQNEDDACVGARRRELERARALSADQLVKLAQISAPALASSAGDRGERLAEALAVRLAATVRDLSAASRSSLEALLGDENRGLGQHRNARSKILEALKSKSRSRSRKRRRRSTSSSSSSSSRKRSRRRR
eukprot:TRINITY_DN1001_c0_g2_i1.p1 TRINITY_DN1001_c0_g2~~TRINITY_DN1001_c0_g2_i1.p1  ORF type:complete len:942 (+),score=260.03 TRINITY_DN1001_c0_g2_i1:132-2957(+)